jgi:hypothetical protein
MRNICVFLFDVSGIMADPWVKAGYECWCVDIQHPLGITQDGPLFKVGVDLSTPWYPPFPKERIAFTASFPPCDHLAVSGARWFLGKGLRRLASSISCFATAAEFANWSEAPSMIENPVSTISTYWRKPDFTFHPHGFTEWCPSDNYTKKTCIWALNGFKMPEEARAPGLVPPDNRIHTAPPSAERYNFRSATPLGFARAVFEANNPLAGVW